jgi:hypothetical protein
VRANFGGRGFTFRTAAMPIPGFRFAQSGLRSTTLYARGDTMPEDATVRVFDRDWPGRPLPVMPGDFSLYLPNGFGLAPAPVIRPWDDPMEA